MGAKTVIAIDLGASSGRLIGVTLQDGKLDMKEIYRFPNEGIHAGDRFYTDVLHIFHEIITGLRKANQELESIDAIGLDTWGVDFAMLDEADEMVGNPFHYRDDQSSGMIEEAERIFGKGVLFEETGVQDMWYNTVYQLLGLKKRNPRILRDGCTFLMIPDVLGFLLTGQKNIEYTSAATTQMYDVKKKDWSEKILKELGMDRSVFPKVLMTGEVKGYLSPVVTQLIGREGQAPVPLIAAAQHDSASAAHAVPAETEDYIFINSGTWSIIGSIIDEPVITREVFEQNYSNEGAAYGKIKLVNTIMGMWLVQELRKSWERKGKDTDYGFLLDAAAKAKPFTAFLDVDDELFIAPVDMEAAIRQYCEKTGQEPPKGQGEFYRTVIESLAFQYRQAIHDLEAITGKSMDTVHFLGGAVRDRLFCQFIANATGKKVVAGPIEATAVGNAMVQLKSLGCISDEKENARILRATFEIADYMPQDTKVWDEKFEQYRKITKK